MVTTNTQSKPALKPPDGGATAPGQSSARQQQDSPALEQERLNPKSSNPVDPIVTQAEISQAGRARPSSTAGGNVVADSFYALATGLMALQGRVKETPQRSDTRKPLSNPEGANHQENDSSREQNSAQAGQQTASESSPASKAAEEQKSRKAKAEETAKS